MTPTTSTVSSSTPLADIRTFQNCELPEVSWGTGADESLVPPHEQAVRILCCGVSMQATERTATGRLEALLEPVIDKRIIAAAEHLGGNLQSVAACVEDAVGRLLGNEGPADFFRASIAGRLTIAIGSLGFADRLPGCIESLVAAAERTIGEPTFGWAFDTLWSTVRAVCPHQSAARLDIRPTDGPGIPTFESALTRMAVRTVREYDSDPIGCEPWRRDWDFIVSGLSEGRRHLLRMLGTAAVFESAEALRTTDSGAWEEMRTFFRIYAGPTGDRIIARDQGRNDNRPLLEFEKAECNTILGRHLPELEQFARSKTTDHQLASDAISDCIAAVFDDGAARLALMIADDHQVKTMLREETMAAIRRLVRARRHGPVSLAAVTEPSK